ITLPKVEQWFYGFIDQEELLEQHLEKVSHELQTRLQAVIARAENMMLEARDLSSEEVFRGTNDLLSAAEAMGTVVQNLRQSVGEYHFQKERIAPLLYEAKRIYETEAKGRGISIRIDLASADGSTPVLEVSRYHLQNALNNLVHNAVKYSFRPRSGRPRTVNIWGRPGKGCYAITIENYGVGILPEEIASGDIFADGYQGKLTQGEYRTGSGKGLYFAKRVIDRHRGRIKASSRLMSDEADREGQPHLNQFTIYLPYEQSKEGSAGGEDDCMD
ncbi:MAG: HAMP domain-containing histidine kinase, partial [Chloroflexi bacterium]|nr:HAMP domain-containing histidine kinase [Chloroflexota bacterium]